MMSAYTTALTTAGALVALTTLATTAASTSDDLGIHRPPSATAPATVLVGEDGVVVPTAVNDRGQVVGYHYGDVANEYRTPFVWQDGVTTDLGTESWQPCDINNRGEIVGDGHPFPAYHWRDGTLTVMALESAAHRITEHGWTGGVDEAIGLGIPYLWRHGVRTDIDVDPEIAQFGLYPSGCGMESYETLRKLDINDHGTFLGFGRTPEGVDASFVVERGRTQVLRDASGVMTGFDLNDAGQVAGAVQGADGPPEAAIWTRGRIVRLGVPASSPDMGSWATAINERGDVVITTGQWPNATWPTGRALVWQRGVLSAIGPVGSTSFANQINDAGQVAGVLHEPAGADGQAFVWQRGVLTRLGDPGQGVVSVVDLSERGHVLALGNRPELTYDSPYALLWTVTPHRR